MSVGRHFHNGGVSWLSLIITAPGGVGRCADMEAGLPVLSTRQFTLNEQIFKRAQQGNVEDLHKFSLR